MNEVAAYKNFVDWTTMQRRGRERIHKASKDPVARAKLIADMPPPNPLIFQPPLQEFLSTLSSLPSYCAPTATPSRQLLSTYKEPGYSFLGSLPAETRNAIYQYAVNYPTCREIFDAYYDQLEKFKVRNMNGVLCGFSVGFHTPTILLLCKQITREALAVLRLRPFVIDRIPPWIMGNAKPLPLTYLISKNTLQNVRFVEIKLSLGDCENYSSGRVWFQVLEDVLKAWSGKNSLLRLKVMIKVSNIDIDGLWDFELRYYAEIVKMASLLTPLPLPVADRFLYGVGPLIFDYRQIDYFTFKHGSRPDLVQYEHWVLDCDYAYRCGFRNPLIRKHPDPHIWQGSVMEWI
ncbi:hypothetical protein FHL15_000080 [Xylaria flabelliformis]|uniref:Uncharacterized protein n=1 Tax=Xylaria flabelliformis TaxID=2512241 RepID=A0A553IEW0_9PEZI|nr:hypothetical protein FHL15_000080 [Xylaria flabelliformis]